MVLQGRVRIFAAALTFGVVVGPTVLLVPAAGARPVAVASHSDQAVPQGQLSQQDTQPTSSMDGSLVVGSGAIVLGASGIFLLTRRRRSLRPM